MINKILNKLFRNNKSLINVTQYPNEYIFETFNSSDTGVWVRSSFVSLHPLELDIKQFENLINVHLNASKKVNYRKYDSKSANEIYKKITKKKTLKKQMENGKLVTIYRKNNLIEITPNINGGTSGEFKGFRPIGSKRIFLDKNLDKERVAASVINLFNECK